MMVLEETRLREREKKEDELDGKSICSESNPISNSMLFAYPLSISTISIVIGAGYLGTITRWFGV